MPFEWFVALRYLREAKSQTALILAAVSVGVSVIVFLSALINGLQTSLIKQTLGSQPHVTLHPPDEAARPLSGDFATVSNTIEKAPQRLRSIDQWPDVLAQVERVPGVIGASPTVSGAGFAERGNAKRPIVVRGIDPERFVTVIDVRAKLRAGHFDVAGAVVLIGSALAEDLGVGVGDKIHLSTPEGVGDLVTVGGIFELGNKAVDRTWVLTSLRQAQSLYALPGGATTIELKVADVFSAERVAVDVHDRTGLASDSWMKLNAELLSGLEAQNSSKLMIQFFVVVAVALGIASVLIVSVVQKSREIGILRAVGTSSRRVRKVFLIQGGVLGLLGSVLGCGLGALFALFFESLAKGPDGAPRFPVDLNATLFASATLLAVGVGLASAFLPARRASKLDPATAIRYG
jgi:lipoprotein-releasing system permease protein